jgi:hypothetical protein
VDFSFSLKVHSYLFNKRKISSLGSHIFVLFFLNEFCLPNKLM